MLGFISTVGSDVQHRHAATCSTTKGCVAINNLTIQSAVAVGAAVGYAEFRWRRLFIGTAGTTTPSQVPSFCVVARFKSQYCGGNKNR